MKKFLAILFILIGSGIVIYYCLIHSQHETITKKTLIVNHCKAEYIHFKNDNKVEFERTHGHVPNNMIELGGAKIEVAKCLCDSYMNTKTAADSIEIVTILNSFEYLYTKNLFKNYVEDFNTDTLHLENVCKNKDLYFGTFVLD